MLDEQGRFGFTTEVLDLAAQLWSAYEEGHGQPDSAKERLLGLAYILAGLRHDVEAIWTLLAGSPELEGVDLAGALAQELEAPDEAAMAALRAEMQRRGWLRDEG